jgi:hypothetical protein
LIDRIDASARDWIGISLSIDGRLLLNDTMLQHSISAYDEPINKAFIGIASFASRIGKACESVVALPPISFLNVKIHELQPCEVYRSTQQSYLMLPLTGLLFNRKA